MSWLHAAAEVASFWFAFVGDGCLSRVKEFASGLCYNYWGVPDMLIMMPLHPNTYKKQWNPENMIVNSNEMESLPRENNIFQY